MGNNHGIDTKKDFRSANVNLICYDKGIRSNFETHQNFIKIKRIVKGALFGTDDSGIFFRVLDLIKNSEYPPFVLIISGSLAEEVLPKIHDEKFIKDILIFCFNKNKYEILINKYTKIRMVENQNFSNILIFLLRQNYTLAQNKKGATFLKNEPLITFSEYENYFYQYHHKITENFCINALKLQEKDKSGFLYYVTDQKALAEKLMKDLKNDDENFHHKIINTYTKESPICYVLNKELRRLNPLSYENIKKYACATLYSLYKFYQENKTTGKVENVLYRALNLKLADILLYKVCEGEIICYPGFTSACTTAITPDQFQNDDNEKDNELRKSQTLKDLILAKKLQDENERLPSPLGQDIAYGDENIVDCCDIIIENNANGKCEYPSAINISSLSDKKAEEERLFPAFSFFKIKKVEIHEGTKEKPHNIFLEVVNKKYNLEERMFNGERVYLDSQTNLLMTRKFINE
jgi:hypothetical protein